MSLLSTLNEVKIYFSDRTIEKIKERAQEDIKNNIFPYDRYKAVEAQIAYECIRCCIIEGIAI